MPLLAKPKYQVLLLLLCCGLFILVIRPWQLYFLNDDFMHIPTGNEYLFLRGGFMRPVANFIILVDKWLFGKNATGYFITSYLFHCGCVFSLYYLVNLIFKTYLHASTLTGVGLITALLFLCYPFHAEALMWVLSVASVFATLLTLLSTLFYIRAGIHRSSLFFSWIFFVAALFTYESIWSALIVFAVVSFTDVIRNRVQKSRALRMFGLMGATFVGYLLLRFLLLDTVAGDGYLEINENLSNINLLLLNLVKLTGRNFTPPFEDTASAQIFFLVSVVIYIVIVFLVFRQNRQWGWLMLISWLGLITGVVTATPLGIDTHFNESERYIYYSSAFFSFFAALAIAILVRQKYQPYLVALLVIGFTALFAGLQKNYRYASVITKTTMEMVAADGNTGRAYFIDVPRKYKGTMVFRISLPDGINWIVPQAAYDSIIVVSQVETPSGILPYKRGVASWAELAAAKGWNRSLPVMSNQRLQVQVTPQDAVFWFRTDGLYKVRVP